MNIKSIITGTVQCNYNWIHVELVMQSKIINHFKRNTSSILLLKAFVS